MLSVELTDVPLVTMARNEEAGDAGAGIAITSAVLSAFQSINENLFSQILILKTISKTKQIRQLHVLYCTVQTTKQVK